jgi:hypothetical protein
VVIDGVEADGAARAELHRTRMEGDLMRMDRVESVTVPAGGDEVALAPGGLHVMLLDLDRRLEPGDRIPVRLLLSEPDTVLELVADVVPLDRVGG